MEQVHGLFRFIVLAKPIAKFVDQCLYLWAQTHYCLFGKEVIQGTTAYAVMLVGYGSKRGFWSTKHYSRPCPFVRLLRWAIEDLVIEIRVDDVDLIRVDTYDGAW